MFIGYTCIIPTAPGYYWEFTTNGWIIHYRPIKAVYSPPILHPHINMQTINVPHDLVQNMGLVIGRDGLHFKTITHSTGAIYIFYRNDQIEIWGDDDAILRAITMFQSHFEFLMDRQMNMQMFIQDEQTVNA